MKVDTAEGSAEGSVPGTLAGLKTLFIAEFCMLRLTLGRPPTIFVCEPADACAASAVLAAVSVAGFAAVVLAGLNRLPNAGCLFIVSAGLKAFFAA